MIDSVNDMRLAATDEIRIREGHMITVVKTRAGYHDAAVREFTITDAGIVLCD